MAGAWGEGGAEDLRELVEGWQVGRAYLGAQLFIYLMCSHEVLAFMRGFLVVLAEQEGGGWLACELLVVGLHKLFLFRREPVLLTMSEQIEGLGIELRIVDTTRCADGGGDRTAEIAARPCGVGERLTVVGGSDEGCHASGEDVLLAAHMAYLHGVFAEDALDLRLFAVGLGIVFIDVDECHATEHALYLFCIVELDVIDEVLTQAGRQDESAESGLMGALWSDEQRHKGVAICLVESFPLCHHGKEPAAEQLREMGIVSGDALCQTEDMVGAAVPGGAAVEELCNGVVGRKLSRAQVHQQVDTPSLAAIEHHLVCHVVDLPVVECLPVGADAVIGQELFDAFQNVEAQLIAALHEVTHLSGDGFLLGGGNGAARCGLRIGQPKDLAQGLHVERHQLQTVGKVNACLLWQAFGMAVVCQCSYECHSVAGGNMCGGTLHTAEEDGLQALLLALACLQMDVAVGSDTEAVSLLSDDGAGAVVVVVFFHFLVLLFLFLF